jgi:hypothetical protein
VAEYVIVRITARAYAKAPGVPVKEAGGVGVTWLAWTFAADCDPVDVIAAELTRIEGKDYQAVAKQKQRDKAKDGVGLVLEEDRRST